MGALLPHHHHDAENAAAPVSTVLLVNTRHRLLLWVMLVTSVFSSSGKCIDYGLSRGSRASKAYASSQRS